MPLRRVAANISELGWLDALFFLAGRALSSLTKDRVRIVRYYLVAQPVPSEAPMSRPSINSTVTVVAQADPLVAQFPRPAHVIARRYQSGSRCLGARAGGRLAGFIWLARGSYDEDMVRCRYEFTHPSESAWDFDVYVAPDFRLGRTFSRLWDAANQKLRLEGVTWTFSRIESSNRGSLLAHKRLGIQKLFSVTFFCIGPLQLTLTSVPPYIHLSTSDRTPPTLRLSPPTPLLRESVTTTLNT